MTNRCPTCKELTAWVWPESRHRCKPKWWCWHDAGDNGYYETDDGATLVFASDAKAAAVAYCHLDHGHERGNLTIVVKAHDRDEWAKVDVEASIEWHAGYDEPEPFVPRKVHPVRYGGQDFYTVDPREKTP